LPPIRKKTRPPRVRRRTRATSRIRARVISTFGVNSHSSLDSMKLTTWKFLMLIEAEPVIMYSRPLTVVSMPRVTMKAWILPLVTNRPFTRPTSIPAATAARMPAGSPALLLTAITTTAPRLMTEPIERSR